MIGASVKMVDDKKILNDNDDLLKRVRNLEQALIIQKNEYMELRKRYRKEKESLLRQLEEEKASLRSELKDEKKMFGLAFNVIDSFWHDLNNYGPLTFSVKCQLNKDRIGEFYTTRLNKLTKVNTAEFDVNEFNSDEIKSLSNDVSRCINPTA